MKVLIVCRGNSNVESHSFEYHQPFILEQCNSLIQNGVKVDNFFIQGKGLFGYLMNLPALRKQINNNEYDLVHAHYGLSGMLTVLQRKCPVVISFIGEMNLATPRAISKVAIKLSSYSIFVSEELKIKSKENKNCCIIPYGINLKTFFPVNKRKAREKMKIPQDVNLCLFSSAKNIGLKNYSLAKQAVDICQKIDIYQLKQGYTRDEVNLLLNACDFVLLTSVCEGSPQIIKEAMACNCPIVSTDVGDVRKIIGDTEGCYITSFEAEDVAEKIKLALAFGKKTNGRDSIKHLEINKVALKIIEVYKKVIT